MPKSSWGAKKHILLFWKIFVLGQKRYFVEKIPILGEGGGVFPRGNFSHIIPFLVLKTSLRIFLRTFLTISISIRTYLFCFCWVSQIRNKNPKSSDCQTSWLVYILWIPYYGKQSYSQVCDFFVKVIKYFWECSQCFLFIDNFSSYAYESCDWFWNNNKISGNIFSDDP